MKRVGRKTIGERFFDFLRYLFLAVLALVTIYPFYNMFSVWHCCSCWKGK